MSRIQTRFESLKARGRKALIPFITAGDPDPEVTVPLMHALVEAGADILELGVPFSDPMADGPVIQHASERALAHHVSLRQVLMMVARFREQDGDTPVVLMGYLNPIEVMGYEAFATEAAAAGVDGVLTVDLPPEEADDFVAAVKDKGIDPIFLIAPTTNEDRINRVCAAASGFLYYVAVIGITGAGHMNSAEVANKVSVLKSHTALPVGVGFGIKDGNSAAQVGRIADAVVVGSALVRKVEESVAEPARIPERAAAFISELRAALDRA